MAGEDHPREVRHAAARQCRGDPKRTVEVGRPLPRGQSGLVADVAGGPQGGDHADRVATPPEPTSGDPSGGENGVVAPLADGGRRITVFGRGSAPALGERVEVDAKVGWREGDEEFTWPPVLFQSARRPAP